MKSLLVLSCLLYSACAVESEPDSPAASYTQASAEGEPEPTAGYAFCSARLHCPEVQQSWYPSGVGGGDAGICDQVCRCLPSCASDADCPLPESGSSEPLCTSTGCALPCDGEVDCPAGMRCVDAPPEDAPTVRGKVCAWPMAGDECTVAL
jgi:hypothetical protein